MGKPNEVNNMTIYDALEAISRECSTQQVELDNAINKYQRLEIELYAVLSEAEVMLEEADAALKLGNTVLVDQRISTVREEMRKMRYKILDGEVCDG